MGKEYGVHWLIIPCPLCVSRGGVGRWRFGWPSSAGNEANWQAEECICRIAGDGMPKLRTWGEICVSPCIWKGGKEIFKTFVSMLTVWYIGKCTHINRRSNLSRVSQKRRKTGRSRWRLWRLSSRTVTSHFCTLGSVFASSYFKWNARTGQRTQTQIPDVHVVFWLWPMSSCAGTDLVPSGDKWPKKWLESIWLDKSRMLDFPVPPTLQYVFTQAERRVLSHVWSNTAGTLCRSEC